LALIEKSLLGLPVTVRASVVGCVADVPVPVTVTVYDPASVEQLV
jgi:hypothetical protein